MDLDDLFSADRVTKTIRRMSSRRDGDDLITHPLKQMLLMEYRTYLADLVSREIRARSFTAERAYPCTVSKRSGGFRELVFPSLIDSIVGRHVIDSLEAQITSDDAGRTFCGRSHANSNREVGDYESWFQVWRDYSASIARAADDRGYTYVFETDVASYFPSIDRDRARRALERRTGIGETLSGLLFHCLESWLVRYEYNTSSGIPIEPNDISRLIAHNYLKEVDALFPPSSNREYLRFVDDTVIFVRTEADANAVRRAHHAALAKIGLSPNSTKTRISATADYEKSRHIDENRLISDLDDQFDAEAFSALVVDWEGKKGADNWSRVTKRLYTVARNYESDVLRNYALKHLREFPDLTDHILRYLAHFDVSDLELEALFDLWKDQKVQSDQIIGISRFLSNARFASGSASKKLADFAVWRIRQDDSRPAALYAQALLFLVLYKHGDRSSREKVLDWMRKRRPNDAQFRHYFIYVFMATGELDDDLLNAMRPLADSDLELTLRICYNARAGTLSLALGEDCWIDASVAANRGRPSTHATCRYLT